MRFLVDNSLSWRLAERLRQAGHDAVHVRDLGLASAPDARIFQRSIDEQPIVLTQDADFGTLMAASATSAGCVVLVRLNSGRVDDQWSHVGSLLQRYPQELVPGAVIVLADNSIRIRRF